MTINVLCVRQHGRQVRARACVIAAQARISVEVWFLEQYKQSNGGTHVFLNERGRRMQRQRVHEIVKRAGAGLSVNVHAHVLRHSTGYALIKARVPIRNVQSFLGHASISSTLVYAHLDETRFIGAVEALA
jgi:site-specific recombinase XerD